MFDGWLAEVPQVVRGWELEPVSFGLAVPGEHNRRNAATALAALELAGVARADAEPVLARFRGAGRRFELVGEAGGVTVVDDYAHHPSEIEATVAAARERTSGRVLVLFQPHLYSRTRHLAHELGAALSTADAACVTEIYKAREQPLPGVDGQARRRCAPPWDARGLGAGGRGRREARRGLGTTRRPRAHGRRGRRRARRPARAGGAAVTLEERVPLARLTTIGTGGACARVRAAVDARRARVGARLGGRARAPGRHRRARLESARGRRGRRGPRAEADRRPRCRCASRASC